MAANIYKGCLHGCLYCFGPGVLRTDPTEYYNVANPRKNIIAGLRKDAEKDRGDDRGIPTSVSLKLVIDVNQALYLIRELHPIVGRWKVGKINYHREIENRIDWITAPETIKVLLDFLGASYYLKRSMTEHSDIVLASKKLLSVQKIAAKDIFDS